MTEALAFIICSAAIAVALATRSPLLFTASMLFFLAPLRLSETNTQLSMLIVVCWSLSTIAAIMYTYKNGVTIDRFMLIECRRTSALKAIIMVAAVLGFFYVWAINLDIRAAGFVEGRDTTQIANILSTIFRALGAYACVVLGFWNDRIDKKHIYIAFIIMTLLVVGAYLINKRGMAVWPVLSIITIRVFFVIDFKKLLKFGTASIAIIAAFAVLVIQMTAERGGVDWHSAIDNVHTTISGERGNGISPNMDQAVIEFVDDAGPFIEPNSLLSGFWGLIPRAIWPGKPDVGIGPTVGALVFGTGGGVIGVGAGTPVSVAAQVAAIGGSGWYWPGVGVVSLIFIWLLMLAKKRPILLYPAMVSMPWLMGSDIGRNQINFLISVLILYITLRAAGMRLVFLSKKTGRYRSMYS